jgi:hypothetical protein
MRRLLNERNKSLFVKITVLVAVIFGFGISHAQNALHGKKTMSIAVRAVVTDNIPFDWIVLKNIRIDQGMNFDANDRIYISPIKSPYAGLVKIKGSPGTRVLISYKSSGTLSDKSGNSKVIIHYEVSGNSELNQAASIMFQDNQAVIQMPTNGIYYLWIGGHLILSNMTGGNLSGQFSLEINFI